jgi:subtilisin family serine protease
VHRTTLHHYSIVKLALVALLTLSVCMGLAGTADAAKASAATTSRQAHALSLGSTRFATLDEAVAAGRVDADVVRELRRDGSVDALVTFQTQTAFSQASQKTWHAKRRAVAFLNAAIPAIRSEKQRTLSRIRGSFRVLEHYRTLPLAYVRFGTEAALLETANATDVASVRVNDRFRAEGVNSLPQIHQPDAARAGFTGAGTYVAVLDTGVDYRRAAFGSCKAPGKPVTCMVAKTWDQAPNDKRLDDDGHGTNVSGIVAGVAPGTKLIVADVFRRDGFTSAAIVNKAIDRLVQLKRSGLNIRAFNLSIGGGPRYTGPCTRSPYAPAFALARSAGILPVVAAGNDAYDTRHHFHLGISAPACVPGAVSVGAVYAGSYGSLKWGRPAQCTDRTTAADQIVCFSQTAEQLTLLAPGALITAAGVTEGGTSQATPHVSGAAAVLAAANPSASLDQITAALATTGPSITDPRSQITRHRLDLAAAVGMIRGGTGGGGGGGGGGGNGDHTAPTVSAPSQSIPAGWTLGNTGLTPLTVSWTASDASGIAQYRLLISINGGTWRDISLTSATQTSVIFNDLQPGSTYQFAIAAKDGAGNWSDWVYGDKNTVDLEQEDAAWYSDGWQRLPWGEDLGGYQNSTSAAGAYVKMKFTGRSIAWVAPSSTLNGYAYLWLDETYLGYVDGSSDSTTPRKIIFSRNVDYGTHTLTIQAVGTSGRPQIDIDAFDILR